ncbi:MAG: IPT/TIG domain-containing protein [bacterium]
MKGKMYYLAILALLSAISLSLFLQACGGAGGDAASSASPPIINSIVPVIMYQGITEAETITMDGVSFINIPVVELIDEGGAATLINASNVTFISETSISFSIIPADFAVGLYDIKITNPEGSSTIVTDGFEITGNPPPTVLSVTPSSGWNEEETRITITGENFVSTPQVIIGTDLNTSAENIAFINSTSLTAIVPAEIAAGTYGITVINPDTLRGSLDNAFMVSVSAVPEITEISPTAMTATNGGELTITGMNFIDGCAVYLSDDPENIQKIPLTPVTFNSSSELQCIVSGGLGQGVYVISVFNPDDQYSPYSSLKLNSSAEGKLGDAGPFIDCGKNLLFGRRGHCATVGKDDIGNSFIYVVGGNDENNIFSSVEYSLSDIFANLSKWRLTKPLNSARKEFGLISVADAAGVSYLYAIGGKDSTGDALSSIERARIFPTSTQPDNLTATAVYESGSLAEGNWIYRVSAMLPDGEGLASDIATVKLSSAGSVQLDWDSVADANGYNIYRVDEANGRMGREHLLYENVSSNTFTDDGSYTIITKRFDDTVTAAQSADAGTLGDGRWYYGVTAVYEGGESAQSAPVSVDLSTGGGGAIDISWPSQEDALYYTLYRSESADQTSDDVYLIADKIIATEYTDTGSVLTYAAGPTDLTGERFTVTGGSLASGTYFYQVSAITERGETLPCSEIQVNVSDQSGDNAVSLDWEGKDEALGYRIYRGMATGGGVLIKSDIMTTSFIDSGLEAGTEAPVDGKISPPSGKMVPIPIGTIGNWTQLASGLPEARYGFGIMKVRVKVTEYVYVVCGNNGASDLDTVYRTSVLANADLDTWVTETNTVPIARMYLAVSVADIQTHPDLTGDTTYLYPMQGMVAGAAESTIKGALIDPNDGSLGTWNVTASDPQGYYGLSGIVGNGSMYTICGIRNQTPTNAVNRGDIDLTGALISWASASAKPNTPRAFHAMVTVNSYMYVIGGQTSNSGNPVTVTDTVEKIPF